MAKQTRATEVGDRIRGDILSGRLLPGQRLMFPDLCDTYKASVGAIREALVSLVAQGMVRTQAHQGYIVTPLTADDLLELTAARLALEPIVLAQAIAEGDLAWESRALTTHHVMSRTPREDKQAPNRVNDDWVVAHEAFHEALFSGANNKRLLAVVRGFAEEARLYRRWSVPLETHRDVAAEHAALLDAVMARNADLAAERLCAHVTATTKLLIENPHGVLTPSTRHQTGSAEASTAS